MLQDEASFNDFIKHTLGSNEDKVGGEQEAERPSLGGGIHRGSTDIVMLKQGKKTSVGSKLKHIAND
jgi:hypothetical protein